MSHSALSNNKTNNIQKGMNRLQMWVGAIITTQRQDRTQVSNSFVALLLARLELELGRVVCVAGICKLCWMAMPSTPNSNSRRRSGSARLGRLAFTVPTVIGVSTGAEWLHPKSGDGAATWLGTRKSDLRSPTLRCAGITYPIRRVCCHASTCHPPWSKHLPRNGRSTPGGAKEGKSLILS